MLTMTAIAMKSIHLPWQCVFSCRFAIPVMKQRTAISWNAALLQILEEAQWQSFVTTALCVSVCACQAWLDLMVLVK